MKWAECSDRNGVRLWGRARTSRYDGYLKSNSDRGCAFVSWGAKGPRPQAWEPGALACGVSFEEWFLLHDRRKVLWNQGKLRGQHLERRNASLADWSALSLPGVSWCPGSRSCEGFVTCEESGRAAQILIVTEDVQMHEDTVGWGVNDGYRSSYW